MGEELPEALAKSNFCRSRAFEPHFFKKKQKNHKTLKISILIMRLIILKRVNQPPHITAHLVAPKAIHN